MTEKSCWVKLGSLTAAVLGNLQNIFLFGGLFLIFGFDPETCGNDPFSFKIFWGVGSTTNDFFLNRAC